MKRLRLSLWLLMLTIALVGAVWQTARLLPQSAIAPMSIHDADAQLALAHTLGRGRIESVEWSPDSSTVLVNTVAGAWLYTPQLEDKAHLPDAFLATYSPDGRYLAVVNRERHLLLLSPTTYEVLHTVESTWRDITLVEFSPDGRYLAYGGESESYAMMQVTPVDNLQDEQLGFQQYGKFREINWNPDGRYVAMLRSDHVNLHVYETETRQQIFHNNEVLNAGRLYWHSPTELMYCNENGEGYNAYVWNVVSREIGDPVGCAYSFAISPDFRQIISSYALGLPELLQWDGSQWVTDTRTMFQSPENIGDFSGVVAWSPDSRYFVIGRNNNSSYEVQKLYFFDTQRNFNTIADSLTQHPAGISYVAFSPNGRYVVSMGRMSTLAVTDISPGARESYKSNHHSEISGVIAWSDSSRQLASSNQLNGISIWNSASGHISATYSGHPGRVTELHWQPNRNRIATQVGMYSPHHDPYDETIRIWDAEAPSSQMPVASLTHPLGSEVIDFMWSPNGQQIISTAETSLYVWGMQSSQNSYQVELGETDVLGSISISPDGRLITIPQAGCHNGTGYTYDLTHRVLYQGTPNFMVNHWSWMSPDSLLTFSFSRHQCGSGGAPPRVSAVAIEYFRASPNNESFWSHDDITTVQLPGMPSGARNGFISPHARYVAATQDDGAGLVWRTDDAQPVFALFDTQEIVWSPNETLAVIRKGNDDLWLVSATGEVLGQFQLPPVSTQQLMHDWWLPHINIQWSPDSQQVAYAYGGVVWLFRVG